MKRFLSRSAGLAVSGGIALLGHGAPAHAAPTATFEDGCGFTDIEVTGVPADGDGEVSVRLGARGGILLRVFAVNDSGRVEIGHWGHGTPDGCTTEPPLPSVNDDCHGNSVIVVNNFGPDPVTGVVVNEEA